MNRFILLCLFVTIIFSTSYSQYTSAELDSFIVAKMEQYHFPGLQACIVSDGQIIWKGAFGYADIGKNRLVSDSTLFYLASISKTFVATALMQLWEQGLFELDDDINNYLPFQVRNPNHPDTPITFRLLLTHTSSIYDNWDILESLRVWNRDSPIALGTLLTNYLVSGGSYYSLSNFLTWVPGSNWNYTNVGAALLGYLVQRISNTSLEQYCQDSIFVPLGMYEASWFLANLNSNHIAMPYHYDGSGYIQYGQSGEPFYPAGQLRTSALQLVRYMTAYMQKGQFGGIRILDSTTVDLMTSIHHSTIYDYWQGLYWFIGRFDVPYVGPKIMRGHNGGSHGARTFMAYKQESGESVGAIVFANGESDDGIFDIYLELAEYGFLFNKIYAQTINLNSSYMQVNNDRLTLIAEFVNPNNHRFSANAVITSIDSVYTNSIPLYDDGNHGDIQAGDGIWGGFIQPLSIENVFEIGINTKDLVSGANLFQNSRGHFTTIGPVELDSYSIVSQDTIPNGGEKTELKITIKNNSLLKAVSSIKTVLSSLDTLTEITSGAQLFFGLIDPGSTKQSSRANHIQLSGKIDSERDIPILVNIYSGDYHFWTDTLYLHVYPAHQSISIYPGDTDNNGKVEANDVFPVGIYFLNEGTARDQTNVVWEEKYVTPWDILAMSYADANGDGIVDEKDVIAIGVNWGNTHIASSINYQISVTDTATLNKYYDNFQTIYNSLQGKTEAEKEIKKLLGSVLEIENAIPQTFALYQNYPNPFNSTTTISYQLPEPGDVELILYNLLGEQVAAIVKEHQDAGEYRYAWDAANFSSGLYFYSLKINGGFIKTRKMLIIK